MKPSALFIEKSGFIVPDNISVDLINRVKNSSDISNEASGAGGWDLVGLSLKFARSESEKTIS